MHTTLLHTSLQHLVDDLDDAVRGSASGAPIVAAVEAALKPHLGGEDLLTPDQRVGDPSGYRQHLLHVAEDGAFSVVALVWLPGQATPIHDHLSWCVVGVHQGAEYETRYRLAGDRLVTDGTAIARIGDVAGLLPPGDIHKVENAGTGLAISLHVYGADLRDTGSSIRRRYDLPVD